MFKINDQKLKFSLYSDFYYFTTDMGRGEKAILKSASPPVRE